MNRDNVIILLVVASCVVLGIFNIIICFVEFSFLARPLLFVIVGSLWILIAVLTSCLDSKLMMSLLSDYYLLRAISRLAMSIALVEGLVAMIVTFIYSS